MSGSILKTLVGSETHRERKTVVSELLLQLGTENNGNLVVTKKNFVTMRLQLFSVYCTVS